MAQTEVALYPYRPSEALPPLFIAFFLLSAAAHAVQCWMKRAWYAIGMFVACITMAVGLGLREASAKSPQNVGLYVAKDCVTFIAIPMFPAALATIFSRALSYVPTLLRYVQPFTPLNFFGTFLGISFLVAVFGPAGASLLLLNRVGDDLDTPKRLGDGFLRTSLAFEIMLILLLVYVSIRLQQHASERRLTKRWDWVLWSVYISAGFVLIRTIFRLVEAIQGWEEIGSRGSPLSKKEVYFWVLDMAMMLASSVTVNVLHPSRFLPASHKTKLLRNGQEGTRSQADGKMKLDPIFRTTPKSNNRGGGVL